MHVFREPRIPRLIEIILFSGLVDRHPRVGHRAPLAFMDDHFGFDDEEELVYYERHFMWLPPQQAGLLQLRGELGIYII